MKRFRPWLAPIAMGLFPFTGLRAEVEPLQPIRPTVTADAVGAGGKFFGRVPDAAHTRRYYIAAESELWDFLPGGRDEVCGLPLPPPVVANRKSGKLRYVQYTDETFRTRVLPTPRLGILGPVLRGVVGDFLAVTFLNRTTVPVSMHPHGVKYDKDSEGAYYHPNPGRGAAIAPGATFTYVWHLDEESGPLPTEPSSKAWLYHSHVTGDKDTNLGLIGSIIVTDPRRARPDGTPNDVDREFAMLFMIFDESGLDEAAIEAAEYANIPGAASAAPGWAQVQQLIEQGSRYSLNGYIFGGLPGLEINEGERTRWYLFALGSERDFHTAHWHGLRVIEEGRRRTDVIDLLPATMKVADLAADNAGTWLFHCHVAEHMQEGMFSRLVVYPRDAVGVDRAPEFAFLGLPQAERSLRFNRTDATLNLSTLPARAQIVLDGTVTVFEAFSVFNQAVRFQFGSKAITFQPNAQGVAREPRAMFRVKNANEVGVVHGGVMDFEIALDGADWLSEVKSPNANAANSPVAITMDIGRVHHDATIQIVRQVTTPGKAK